MEERYLIDTSAVIKYWKIYHTFVANSFILTLSPAIIEHTINIRKTYKVKLPDAFIAATALASGNTLLADNDKDFLKIKELKYINPRDL